MNGIYIAMATPFNKDGSLNLEAHKRNIEKWNKTEIKGYLVLGSTGEGVHLSHEEKLRLVEATLEAKSSDKKVFAGTGLFSTEETVKFTNEVAKLGVDFALVITPFFFKSFMTGKALLEHYRRVADAAKIPVFIYNVPQYTGVSFPLEILPELAGHENIAGMKDSSGNIYYDARILEMKLPDFMFFVGNFTAIYQNALLGANGGILAVANIAPSEVSKLYELARKGDAKGAGEIYLKLADVNAILVGKMGPAGVKYAMDLLGYEGLYPRPPLQPLTEEEKRKVEELLKTKGLL